jgi:lipoprotein-anchoring transpeptidase ErfK/SrfK
MLSRRAVITRAAAALLAAPAATAAFAQSSEDDPYPLPKFDYGKLPEAFRPAVVDYSGRQWPGTIIVDTPARQLYLVLQGNKAMRWGCAVGKDGFRWAGLADVGRKVMWPKWTPPKEMIARSPEKAKWANGMPGGPDDPLSIGKNASSGCIRMVNQDVVELYRRVPIGSRVVVLAEGV